MELFRISKYKFCVSDIRGSVVEKCEKFSFLAIALSFCTNDSAMSDRRSQPVLVVVPLRWLNKDPTVVKMVLASLLGSRLSAFIRVGGALNGCRHSHVLLRRDAKTVVALSRTYGSPGSCSGGKKVLFFGTDSFSLETLKTLHQSLWVSSAQTKNVLLVKVVL